ncbi:hypothetical protein L3Q82_001265 [Scortum barcoo]|uniref:Uncharacterized protein n=1 Tax=Scortum barcoo TaxID=214431 RepID=A0ACB8W706_9TELE|nr:hypothetical protein L3Q82_001265 [Scortum barcoo]
MGCAKIMWEKHGEESCKQLPLWVKMFGFPKNGSFSARQIQNLQYKLEEHESMWAEIKVDWRAFNMWKSETERRLRQQSKGKRSKREGGGTNQPPQPSQSQTELDPLPPSAAQERHQLPAPAPDLHLKEISGHTEKAAVVYHTPSQELTQPPCQQNAVVVASPSAAGDSCMLDKFSPVSSRPCVLNICVYKAWTPDDMRSMASHLPDIDKQGGNAFVRVLCQIVEVYRPSLREIKSLLLYSMKLKVGKVRGDWLETDMLYDWTAGAEYRRHVEDLYERIKTTFLPVIRWREVTACRQQPGEMVADYLSRLTQVFQENSGIPPPEDPQMYSLYEYGLKNQFLEGMDERIANQIRKHCIGWETCRLSLIESHAIHAERNLRNSEEKAQQARDRLNDRLIRAQLRAVQALEKGRGGPPRSRGRAPRRGSRYNGCWNCGGSSVFLRGAALRCVTQQETGSSSPVSVSCHFDGAVTLGKTIRLPPEVNRILYVRNLPYKITAEEMYDIFGKYGPIRQIRTGNTPETRGTAYVVYEDIFDAKNACDHLSGFNVCNRYLVVLYYNANRAFQKMDTKKKEEQLKLLKEKYGINTDPPNGNSCKLNGT